MSKNKKLNNKGIIPPAMRGKRFSALSDLGFALGFRSAEQSAPKAKNCRKCGTAMRNIPGTNVWVCDGMVENADKKMVPCGNRAMTSAGPRIQSSENFGNSKPKHQGAPANAQVTTA